MWFIAAAAKLKGIAGALTQRQHLTVEKDPIKLCTEVCGANYFKTGENPKIKPDSEYPDWLFELRTDWEPVPLEEETDAFKYWERVIAMHKRRAGTQMKVRRRIFDFSKFKYKPQ